MQDFIHRKNIDYYRKLLEGAPDPAEREWVLKLRFGCFAVLFGLAFASPTLAQAPATSGQSQFRDPKTGQIWTPETVSQDGKPINPEDRAFDPQSQAVVRGTSVQTPAVSVMGSVPITAGPTMPIATIDDASLSVIPGQRWRVVLYLNNNSAGTINPAIDCRFTNAGRPVEEVRANLPPVTAGQRVGTTIYGPQANLFVDRAECRLASPS
jgi:hypothetical protein